jgi:hypothetical protein
MVQTNHSSDYGRVCLNTNQSGMDFSYSCDPARLQNDWFAAQQKAPEELEKSYQKCLCVKRAALVVIKGYVQQFASHARSEIGATARAVSYSGH